MSEERIRMAASAGAFEAYDRMAEFLSSLDETSLNGKQRRECYTLALRAMDGMEAALSANLSIEEALVSLRKKKTA